LRRRRVHGASAGESARNGKCVTGRQGSMTL
jgi:hypothetical protein